MEKIEDLFKKFVYTGVGLVSLTKDRLEKTIEELIKEEKISTKEGEKIVKDFFKNTESKKKELEENLKKIVDKAVTKFNFASAKELEELTNRVKLLEELLKKH
jgi:polyhydroxyalkanoate synthesis regulator phasin